MIAKGAFASSTSDPIEKAFQDAYHGSSRHWLSESQMKIIKRCLPTYRGLVRKVAQSPTRVAKLLFADNNSSNLWYYPCDIIELRQILNSKQLSWHAPILLFAPKTASILMPEYPLMLVFDRSVAKDGITLGGVHVRQGNRLPMADSLKRIMLRDYLSEQQSQTIQNIIKESMGHVPTYLLTNLPGFEASEQHKSASSKNRDKAKILREWFEEHRPIDTRVYITPDFKRLMLSVGDAEANYDEHKISLQKAMGKDTEVEVCDECGCGEEFVPFKPRGGKFCTVFDRIEIMGNNWYSRVKTALGPSDTFGKEFFIGKLPKTPDPEEVHTNYELPHKALSLKKGDRVAYRYTDMKLPVHNDSKSMPMTRSLVQEPKSGTVTHIDAEHIHVRWDKSEEDQKIPIDQEMFLIKVSR